MKPLFTIELALSPTLEAVLKRIADGLNRPPSPDVSKALAELKGLITPMATNLDRLTTSVTNVNTKADSIIALVNGLAQQIRDNAADPAALGALADQLDADSQKLADAVAANTPPTDPAPDA